MGKLTVAEIDRLRALPTETQVVEFKEAQGKFERSKVREYCVAIANEMGGLLILGIHDKQPDKHTPRKIVGTSTFQDFHDLEKWVLDACGFRVDVEEIQHPEGRIIAIKIPSRPLGFPYHVDGRYLMRAGSNLEPMTPERLKGIFAESAPHWGEEPCNGPALERNEIVGMLDCKTYFELLEAPYPTSASAVVDRLVANRLLVAERGRHKITRLAALLLANKLEEFPDLSRRAARVVVYSGTTKESTRLDAPGSKGYASGFQGLVRFVMEHMPRYEVVEDALRNQVTLVPEIVIRELVANALVHQDLTMTGMSPMVEIYSDRIEISNPGLPVVSAQRFIDEYQSRNEHLAELMRQFRICEEKGSGIDRVIMAAEESNLMAPDFRIGTHRTHVVVFGPREFKDVASDERIRAAFQHCVLKWVKRDHMTNQSLRARFRVGDDKSSLITSVIQATQAAGLIKPDEAVSESKKFARYLPFWA